MSCTSLSATFDYTSSLPCLRDCFIVECYVSYGAVFFVLLLCDDDISPFIDVLDDFHAVNVVALFMIDDHMLMTDYIGISTKVIISSGRCSLLSYTVTS